MDHVACVSKLSVCALQETRFNERELEAYRRAAKKKGFKLFYTFGRPTTDGHGHRRERGGLCFLVDKRLQARLVASKQGDESQFLGLLLEDWFLGNCYAPPLQSQAVHPQHELCELFEEVLVESCVDGRWLLMGDFNEEPGNSCVAEVLEAHGGQTLRVRRGTRWDSQREVDWFVSNSASLVGVPAWEEVHIADHLLLNCVISCRDKDLNVGYLKMGPSWRRPASIGRQEWCELLEASFEKCVGRHDLLNMLVGSIDVDVEWSGFMSLLDELMRCAFARVRDFEVTETEARVVDASLRRLETKGQVPERKMRPSARTASVEHFGDMGVHKARKKVARLYELKRVLQFLEQAHPNSAQLRVAATSLLSKLKLGEEGWSLRVVVQRIQEAKDALKTQAEALRRWRLSCWKTRMHTDPKYVGRWLKSRKSTVGVEIQTCAGRSCLSDQEAVDAISDYWLDFWQTVEQEGPSLQDICEHVLRDTPVGSVRGWVAPGADDLRKIAQAMRGASGGDGWSGDELSCLPAGVWKIFSIISDRWLQSGCLPEPLLHARTVYLVKEHKLKGHCLRADHARPITVLSAFWRCFSSAWLKQPQTEDWVRSVLHSSIVYGKGGDLQVAAAAVLQSFAECGFCASLDYTKCFDLLRPEVSTALLERLGFDARMSTLCGCLWSRHVRWQSWNGHVDVAPLRAPLALPQGDPFGPLICAVWLSAGARFLERTLPGNVTGSGVMSVFMDDRTFTAGEPGFLRAKYDAWTAWSRCAGLVESGDKAQFAGARARQQRALRPYLDDDDTLRSNVLFLGVVSRGKPRSNHDKETERITVALERLRILGSLRLSTEVMGRYANMFCLSAVSYGWIARLPTWGVSNKLWAAVKRAQKVAWMSNKWLRAVVLGGNSHVDVRSACGLFRVLYQLRRKGSCVWNDLSYTPLWTLRKWLKERGWIEVAPWSWERQGLRLCLRANAQLQRQLHNLRSGWREYCWSRFMSSGRHEAVDVGNVDIQVFRRCDFEHMRRLMKNPACRSVALGATVSPAWFQTTRVFSDRCLWCDALGTWHHLCWECSESPLRDARPQTPRCNLLRRWGWGTKSETGLILPYLAQVQELLWRSRWRS